MKWFHDAKKYWVVPAALLALVFIFSTNQAAATEKDSFPDRSSEMEAEHLAPHNAIAAYDADYEAHIAQMEREAEHSELIQQITDQFVVSDSGAVLYPEDYAGMYLDDDAGLHILSTSDAPSFVPRDIDLSGVQFEQKRYSKNQLNAWIDQLVHQNPEWIGFGISEKDNAIQIDVAKTDALPLSMQTGIVHELSADALQIPSLHIDRASDDAEATIPVIFNMTDPAVL